MIINIIIITALQTVTYINFNSEDLALLLQARWTIGRYQALGDGRQKLVSLAGDVPCGLNDLTARSSQIRTRYHLR